MLLAFAHESVYGVSVNLLCAPASFGDRTFAVGPQVYSCLPPMQFQTTWAVTVIRPVQAVTEDIFIRTVRPQRSVNCF